MWGSGTFVRRKTNRGVKFRHSDYEEVSVVTKLKKREAVKQRLIVNKDKLIYKFIILFTVSMPGLRILVKGYLIKKTKNKQSLILLCMTQEQNPHLSILGIPTSKFTNVRTILQYNITVLLASLCIPQVAS